MKKTIKNVDEVRGIVQVTIADERWYLKTSNNEVTGMPEYKAVPSVTFITQSYPKGIGYYKWLAEKGWDEAEAIKTQAGDKGTKVHLAIEDILKGVEVRIDSKYPNKTSGQDEELTLEECDAILSFLKWKAEMEEENILETITFEHTLFSEKYNYAGTLDWAVKITNKETQEVSYWLIDFKTSQQVWPSHSLQLSAYKHTIENAENNIEGFNPTNIRMAILQVGYRRNKDQYKFTEIEDDFDMFLVAQKIWEREHGDEQPTKKDYPIILSAGTKAEEIVFGEAEDEKTVVIKKPKSKK